MSETQQLEYKAKQIVDQCKRREQQVQEQERKFAQLNRESSAKNQCQLPPTENDRLQLLYAKHILDSPSNPTLHQIVKLAAKIFQSNYAGICLIDENRAHLKTVYGLAQNDMPRNESMCANVVAQKHSISLPNCLANEQVQQHPICTKFHLNFYAASPIIVQQQALGTCDSNVGLTCIGTVFVCDDEAKPDPGQAKMCMLDDLANLAAHEIHTQSINFETEKEKQFYRAISEYLRACSSITSTQQLKQLTLLMLAQNLDTSHVFMYEHNTTTTLDSEEPCIPVLDTKSLKLCMSLDQPLCIADISESHLQIPPSWTGFKSAALAHCKDITIGAFHLVSHVWFPAERFFISELCKCYADACETFLQNTLFMSRRKQVDQLLFEMMPTSMVSRLMDQEHNIADSYESVSVVFIDIVHFTELMNSMSAKQVVATLTDLFEHFDLLADKHQLYRVKTIGDAYMAVSGIFSHNQDHANAAARFGIEVQKTMSKFPVQVRIGISTGPVVAGVLGIRRRLQFDVWGTPVILAHRLQAAGEPGKVIICEEVAKRVRNEFAIQYQGKKTLKGFGTKDTYFVFASEQEQ